MENEQHTQTETEGDPATASMPPSSSPVKRLTKRKDSGWFTGVAAGVGAYVGVDPLWVRLAFAVLTFVGGIGLAVYLLAIFFLPDATQDEVDAEPIVRRPYNQKWTTKEWYLGAGRWISIILLFVAACSVGSAWNFGGFSFVFAILLAGVGLYLLADVDRTSNVRGRFFGDTPTAYAVPQNYRSPVDPEIERQREEYKAQKTARRRDRKTLEAVTLGSLMVVVGMLAVLDRTDTHDFAVSTMLASALLVLGCGVLVGAWRGRSFLLIFLAFLLTPFVIASNVVDGVQHGVGEQRWTPIDAAQLRGEYRFGAGRAELDLSQVHLVPGETRSVHVGMNAGLLVVELPAGVGYDVTASVDYGNLDVLDVDNGSVGPDKETHRVNTGTGTLIVVAELNNGKIMVDQASNVSSNVGGRQ
jgi:phage shock protein PspC (stress-responsive transcriptional regulator)